MQSRSVLQIHKVYRTDLADFDFFPRGKNMYAKPHRIISSREIWTKIELKNFAALYLLSKDFKNLSYDNNSLKRTRTVSINEYE